MKRDKNSLQYENRALNSSADKMLGGITAVVNQAMKSTPKFSGAIISRVNGDGTVDVYFPPDSSNVFTNISNQTPFELHEGDSVELVLKNGSYSNCWVSAKHGQSYKTPTNTNDYASKLQRYEGEINTIKSNIESLTLLASQLQSTVSTLSTTVSNLSTTVSNIQSSINTLNSSYTALEARVKALEDKK